MLQHFFIEGKHLGSAERLVSIAGGVLGKPMSLLLFCEQCGDTFARAPIEGRPWVAYRLLCRKCIPAFNVLVPGSIWLSWDREFTSAFPDAVLRWEFNRHLEWFERNENG